MTSMNCLDRKSNMVLAPASKAARLTWFRVQRNMQSEARAKRGRGPAASIDPRCQRAGLSDGASDTPKVRKVRTPKDLKKLHLIRTKPPESNLLHCGDGKHSRTASSLTDCSLYVLLPHKQI